jgi:hypothetical protein
MDADANGSIDFSVRPLSNTVMSARAAHLDFSVTLDGQSRTLPIFLHQAQASAPTYEFSNNYETLTLFSNFPHGANLERLNSSDIPELAEHASDVKTLVMKGDKNVVTSVHVARIKLKRYVPAILNSVDVLPSIENVSLPEYNGDLSYDAFGNCAWLKSIDAPGVTGTIGQFAFQGCSNLKSVLFPNVTIISNHAFGSCSKLKTVNIPATSIGAVAFSGCSSLESVSFPNITSIEDAVFNECSSLERVSFPLVTSVGMGAFTGCSKLVEADLPNARTFGGRAFVYVSQDFTLKINSPSLPLAEDKITFGFNSTYNEHVFSNTETITLYLGTVRPARPETGVTTWNGYTDGGGAWHDYTWKEIKPYQ